MPALASLYLGLQPSLERLPSLDGLVNLRSLTLAICLSLSELPSLASLTKLQSLALIMLPSLDFLPDLTPLESLTSFVTIDRGTYCCNGFRDGHCDLNDSLCDVHPLWGTPRAACLDPNRTDKLLTDGTRAVLARFERSVCAGQAIREDDLGDFPTREGIAQCNGTLFRECVTPVGSRAGMCYNQRMMPIACDSSPYPIVMRRQQIAKGVGNPCDPSIEAWLGCQAA